MKNQFKLSILNFLDLNLLGIDEVGKKHKYNFSIRHHMTSFGFMVAGNVFFKREKFSGFISSKFYQNKHKTFPRIDIELRNKWGMIKLAGWQQPKNQLYDDNERRTGGLIGFCLSPPLKKIKPYINLTLKSKGWVPGNPYLGKNITFSIGGRWIFESK